MLDSAGPVCDVVDPSALPPEELTRLYEREHARAEAAEAEITALKDKLGEAEARGELNGLRGIFESNREKLAAARAALKELGRSQSARNLHKLEKKLARLQGLLNAAGIDSGPHTIVGMRKEISRLKAVIARQAETLKELEAENERLRSARATHEKARFGSTSEKKSGKGSGSGSSRKRGQQADKPGHGRTPRPDMERKSEAHDPPEEERVCPCCGLPYVKNGSHDS